MSQPLDHHVHLAVVGTEEERRGLAFTPTNNAVHHCSTMCASLCIPHCSSCTSDGLEAHRRCFDACDSSCTEYCGFHLTKKKKLPDFPALQARYKIAFHCPAHGDPLYKKAPHHHDDHQHHNDDRHHDDHHGDHDGHHNHHHTHQPSQEGAPAISQEGR